MLLPAAKRRDVVVTAIAARDPARARALADAHGVPNAAPDYAALIARNDVDLVYVALPVSLHAPWSIRALEAGKAVLCEKPFAMNAAEAASMVAAAERCGRPLLEAIHYRFHPLTEQVRAIVASGALGRIEEAEGQFVYPVPYSDREIRWRADLGGGAIMDDGCYPLHALRTLLGCEPRVVCAHSRPAHGVDAETWAELAFDNVPARIHVSLETSAPAARLVIKGDQGQLTVHNFITPHWGGAAKLERQGKMEVIPVHGPITWEAQLSHVLDVLRGEASPLTGGADAIGNMMAIDAVKRAAAVDFERNAS